MAPVHLREAGMCAQNKQAVHASVGKSDYLRVASDYRGGLAIEFNLSNTC